jgi:hypothetical protein
MVAAMVVATLAVEATTLFNLDYFLDGSLFYHSYFFL